MMPAALAWYAIVPLLGALMCATPALTRPTLQFGVRVPPARVGATVIRQQRRTYYWRSAAVAACCAATVVVFRGPKPWWVPGIILPLELAADVSCLWLARRKIIAVKTAEGWFAGLRQTVVTDTSWRTEPHPFPVRWLIPAIAVIAATTVIGITRYPHLPGYLSIGLATAGGHRVPRSPARAFAMVIVQVYVTGVGTGLMVLVHRSRPDIDAADPAASLGRYRNLLDRFTRAALTLFALIDLTFLLASLQLWQLYHLHGISAALLILPADAGVLILIAVAIRAGRDRVRLAGSDQRPGRAGPAGRDDDRFWKAGLVYINRSDPAIMVPARIGIGWSLNLGNPAGWLIIATIVAIPTGLALIRMAAGI
jgi:uncharacterized membrane protein